MLARPLSHPSVLLLRAAADFHPTPNARPHPTPRLATSPPAGLADLERALARINAAGSGVGSARDAPHVILYEDVAKRRVKAYAAALGGLQKIQDAVAGFQGERGWGGWRAGAEVGSAVWAGRGSSRCC